MLLIPIIGKMFNLKNKTIVITGASGHIGKEVCNSLAKANANIAILTHNYTKGIQLSKKLIKQYNIKSSVYNFNFNDLDSLDNILLKVCKDFKYINCLVNCGYYTSQNDIKYTNLKVLNEGIHGTLLSTIVSSQKIINYLKKTKGNIINIGSMYGVVSPDPKIYMNQPINPLTYSISKSAIIHFTKYAAANLAKYNIRVNSISPGAFPSMKVQKNKKFISNLKKKIPLGRIGNPKEIGGSVVFLASDESSYITGHNLIIDGGWTII